MLRILHSLTQIRGHTRPIMGFFSDGLCRSGPGISGVHESARGGVALRRLHISLRFTISAIGGWGGSCRFVMSPVSFGKHWWLKCLTIFLLQTSHVVTSPLRLVRISFRHLFPLSKCHSPKSLSAGSNMLRTKFTADSVRGRKGHSSQR